MAEPSSEQGVTVRSLLRSMIQKTVSVQVRSQKRGLRYIATALLILAVIWGGTIATLLFKAPSFESKWTLILPGTGASSTYNIQDIGQISTSGANPFSNPSFSPKVVYKNIITSREVIGIAAKKLKVPPNEVKGFKVKLTDQTALLDFTVKGGSPKNAQDKSWAIYHAFSDTINKLRSNEALEREKSYKANLDEYSKELSVQRAALSKYQINANIVSEKQFEHLATTVEDLHYQVILSESELKQIQGQKEALVKSLGLSAKLAQEILTFQSDKNFQSSLKSYSEANQQIRDHASKWGRNHPEMKKYASIKNASYRAMENRAKKLYTGSAKDIKKIILALGGVSQDSKKSELLSEILLSDSKLLGLRLKTEELKKQEIKLKKKLNAHSQFAQELEILQKNYKISEAIFTSYLARTYSSKQDFFGSYPLFQMMSPPSLPQKKSSPKAVILIPAAVIASIFFLIGLWLMWIRKPFILKIFPNA